MRARKWDEENAPDAVFKYIIKNKDVTKSSMTDKMIQDKGKWERQVRSALDRQNAKNKKPEMDLKERLDEELESYLYDVFEYELRLYDARGPDGYDQYMMAGLSETEYPMSIEGRTIAPVTAGSFPAHEVSRTPMSVYKAAGATKTISKRLRERDNEKASAPGQISSTNYFITRTISESSRLDSIPQSEQSEAHMSNPITATAQDAVDQAPIVDTPDTEAQQGGRQIRRTPPGWKDPNVPGHGKARMKTTSAAALAQRKREDAKAEIAFEKSMQKDLALDEANRAEIRRREEEFIKKDRFDRKTVQKIEDYLHFHYHSEFLPFSDNAIPEQEMRESMLRRAATGENLFPGFAGAEE